eukprot:763338-Hanusia_phi.AAC.7
MQPIEPSHHRPQLLLVLLVKLPRELDVTPAMHQHKGAEERYHESQHHDQRPPEEEAEDAPAGEQRKEDPPEYLLVVEVLERARHEEHEQGVGRQRSCVPLIEHREQDDHPAQHRRHVLYPQLAQVFHLQQPQHHGHKQDRKPGQVEQHEKDGRQRWRLEVEDLERSSLQGRVRLEPVHLVPRPSDELPPFLLPSAMHKELDRIGAGRLVTCHEVEAVD